MGILAQQACSGARMQVPTNVPWDHGGCVEARVLTAVHLVCPRAHVLLRVESEAYPRTLVRYQQRGDTWESKGPCPGVTRT